MSVYSDTKWGLKMHLCFINELGKVLSYNGFSAGEIDHPRATADSLEQIHF